MQLILLLNCWKFTFFVGLELCNICLYIQVECSFWVTFLFNKKVFFFLSGFSFTETDNSQDSRGREGTILLHSSTSTRSPTFRHLFATFHFRWLSHILNRNARIYQTATRWDLPPYRITTWLIDDVILIFVCLHVELILGFVTAIWHEKLMDSNSHRLSSLYYKRIN